MAIELRQQLKLTQQLVMTPQLQQAIKLLQLSRLELVDAIQQELEQNPALEERMEAPDAETPEVSETPASEDSLQEIEISEKVSAETDWDSYLDEYSSTGRVHFESEEREAPRYENFISGKETLHEHLLWQLSMTGADIRTQQLAGLIIGNINTDGYLDTGVEDIVGVSDCPERQVLEALRLVQSFDPPGVAARNLQECLLLQIKRLGIASDVVEKIISQHLKHLENKNFKAIAKSLKLSIETVIAAVSLIRSLEPKPGREYHHEAPVYITPDIYVYKHGNDFLISLNDDGLPRLHINPYYKKAMRTGEKVSGETKEYLQEKMRSASWLIKSIQQRQKTIYNVMESIVRFQRDFFEKGIAHLKPMVLRDVAQDIQMHESTISRVTTNKYAYTPQGLFELKYFFNSSISRVEGEAMASASVLDKIKQLVESEDPQKPYSDLKLAEILEKEHNINIARRTIAKYREILKILPSSKRRQY
ncbi:RNA polymerase RpoN-/SigL-like sigma 54 subunit [Desulfobotulus alkaliphilus]|uniref:RNA polymerase RpoN-/SigL-like sigma 54 subunit n=1 Tax=Desulfobotulus alkaliphilus TaxID=622671 RepID=A0A562S7C7_9BACT|nr:RNA polymerase factor sigma-54 [Desulfobotulus alkaliphilus]TWI77297.1 RNA polymerase RpoN-/SigL-like sigma 54 subunit [Desulfobotulus alkaliphilus]